MHLLTTINGLRRAVTRRMTRNLGRTRLDENLREAGDKKIENVLICRPNHRLGNLLLITPLLQEVTETFPRAKVDLFVKGTVAPVLFKNYGNIHRIIRLPKKPLKNIIGYVLGWIAIKRHRYDLVINVVNHSASGKLSTQFANARLRFLGDIDEAIELNNRDHQHMAKYPVYSFRKFVSQLGYQIDHKPVHRLDLKLTSVEIAKGKEILGGLVNNANRTLCIYTYATGLKCYSQDWWEAFYERLKSEYPGHNILEILPIENVSQIAFKAPAFYSRDLREIGSVIANTDLFIGADSGMMHLASATGVTTVGLFKSDNMTTYAPYGNNSMGINTNVTSLDEFVRILEAIPVAS